MESIHENTVVVQAIPRPKVNMATRENAGLPVSTRSPNRTSRNKWRMA